MPTCATGKTHVRSTNAPLLHRGPEHREPTALITPFTRTCPSCHNVANMRLARVAFLRRCVVDKCAPRHAAMPRHGSRGCQLSMQRRYSRQVPLPRASPSFREWVCVGASKPEILYISHGKKEITCYDPGADSLSTSDDFMVSRNQPISPRGGIDLTFWRRGLHHHSRSPRRSKSRQTDSLCYSLLHVLKDGHQIL